MPDNHQDLSETHILGAHSHQMVIRVDQGDTRDWLKLAPVCGMLARHRIAHVGVCAAKAPYRIVRLRQSGTYFMACFGGEGRILIDGRWQLCRAGMGCLLPPHSLNAFHAVPGKTWEFVWVRYQAVPPREIERPMVTSSSPVLASFAAEPLRLAVLGLAAECRLTGGQGDWGNDGDDTVARSPSQKVTLSKTHHWVELIQDYVRAFAQPAQQDERLSTLWSLVAGQLEADWTLQGLAREAHVSEEHLRRLCTKELGRTPMRHVTWLRMRHAAELLATTSEKVESVARAVGYQNPFVFSTTFKKWIGWRPSEHRRKG
jgi:AraC-like DNA-binding protein